MDLIIASNNKGKAHELKQMLGDKFANVLTLKEAGIYHDTIEDGDTFVANARKKVMEIHDICGGYVLADDSGLEVDALGGAPGVYSARYAGEPSDDKANNLLLLKNLDNVTQNMRTARFVCVLILITPDKEEIVANGTVEGIITREPQGDNGFGYDSLFYNSELKCTFAQAIDEQKHSISHRGRAIEKLLKKLENI